MEIAIVAALIIVIVIYGRLFNPKKFFDDNEQYFKVLKEEDYEFLVIARYGDKANPEELFRKRLSTAVVSFGAFAFILLTLANDSKSKILYFIIAIIIGLAVYKAPYTELKRYYKKNLHHINLMLPYYLKSLEILVQHYTVPVAIGKSIEDAPEIFKSGLREMIAKIDAGDSSIDPYMDFANKYPVRDSMRMMRLLYRLGAGSQEKKQERLLMFSKTVSSLQNKARETKYKERLDKMEGKTMIMLVCTGAGVMSIILLSMLILFKTV